MTKQRLISLMVVCLGLAVIANAQGGSSKERDSDLIEEILTLQRRIDALIEQLSPAGREELQRRLQVVEEPPGKESESEAEPPPDLPVPAETAAETSTAETSVPAPCNTLSYFDDSADGKVSPVDRYWRYLYLWSDRDGDGELGDKEIDHVFERDVGEIYLSLKLYTNKKGASGDIWRGDRIVFELIGRRAARGEQAILLVDASGIQRWSGPQILSPDGALLDGYQPFRKGLQLRTTEGEIVQLNCP
jgi:hypothetical protein